MIKDIEYFLEKEEEFCKAHPDYGELCYDEEIEEMSEVGINDRNNFLSDRTISEYYSHIKNPLGNEDAYGFTEAQKVFFRMFHAKDSVLFRDDYYYEGKTEVVQNMLDTLDSAIALAPRNTNSLLYRFCVDHDRADMQEGDIITFPYNLTCTNYDWEQSDCRNVYVITPLQDGNTKARNLFEIYMHGDEMQVNFLRGTSFVVTKVEATEGTEFKKFYLEEIA